MKEQRRSQAITPLKLSNTTVYGVQVDTIASSHRIVHGTLHRLVPRASLFSCRPLRPPRLHMSTLCAPVSNHIVLWSRTPPAGRGNQTNARRGDIKPVPSAQVLCSASVSGLTQPPVRRHFQLWKRPHRNRGTERRLALSVCLSTAVICVIRGGRPLGLFPGSRGSGWRARVSPVTRFSGSVMLPTAHLSVIHSSYSCSCCRPVYLLVLVLRVLSMEKGDCQARPVAECSICGMQLLTIMNSIDRLSLTREGIMEVTGGQCQGSPVSLNWPMRGRRRESRTACLRPAADARSLVFRQRWSRH